MSVPTVLKNLNNIDDVLNFAVFGSYSETDSSSGESASLSEPEINISSVVCCASFSFSVMSTNALVVASNASIAVAIRPAK